MYDFGYPLLSSDRDFYQTHGMQSLSVIAFHSLAETEGSTKLVTCDYRRTIERGKYRVADVLLESPLFWRTLVAGQIKASVGRVNIFHKKNLYFRDTMQSATGPYCYLFPGNEIFTDNLQNLCSVLMSVSDSRVQDFIMGIPNLAHDDVAGKEKEKQRIMNWLGEVGLEWLPNGEEIAHDENAWEHYVMF